MRWALLVWVAGCGRLDFGLHADVRTADGGDASLDAPAGCQHTFCDNFDRTTTVEAGWSSIANPDNVLSLDESVGVSAPGSLRAQFSPLVDASDYLEIDLVPVATTQIHVAFDFELDTGDTTAETDLVVLHWVTPPAACTGFGFNLVRTRSLNPVQLVMQETYTGCGGNTDDPLPTLAGFHHFDIEVMLGTSTGARLLVQEDGTTELDKLVPVAVPSSQVTLTVGAPHIQDAEQPWDMHYDNVAVDVQ